MNLKKRHISARQKHFIGKYTGSAQRGELKEVERSASLGNIGNGSWIVRLFPLPSIGI